jgi:flagellar hook-associated protein 3 FlgL
MTISSRSTQRMLVDRSLASLQAGFGRLARAQEQLHTGRVINRPSDSPIGTNTAMRLRAETATQTQYARNADDGLAWLGRVDDTLSGMLDGVNRARNLALNGASTGSSSQASREAMAAEVEQIRASLLSQANTTHLGRPIFGGTTNGGQAYNTTTGAYVGQTVAQPVPLPGTTVERTVADGVSVRVDVTGPEAFGPAGADLFTVLAGVVDHLRNDPAQLGADLDKLDGALQRMRTQLADVGTRTGRVEQAAQTAKDVTLDLQASLSDVENVDLAKAMVDLQLQEVAYQASLATTARVLQPSLVDFLR